MAGIGIAIAGLAVSGASAGMGFAQASKARKLAAQENQKAERLMNEARAKAEKNVYEGLQIPMEAYNREFRENTAQQMQNVQSLQEAGGRTLAAGIGKVAGQGQQGNAEIQGRLGQALYDNDKMKADGAQDVNQQLIQMDVGQSSSATRKAADLKTEAAQATQGAISSVGSALSYGTAVAAPLFPNNASTTADILKQQNLVMGDRASGQPLTKTPLNSMQGGKTIQNPMNDENYWNSMMLKYDENLKKANKTP